jgi:hypothetical protein
MRSRKRKLGSALALGAALAFAFIVICVGLFYISMYFGGERETKNANDSGALNVGKKTATFAVQLQGGDEQQFNDVAENGTSLPTPVTPGTDVSLRNVNRIWAKAFLIALNSEAMGGDGDSNVKSIQEAANAISDRLADALDDPNNLKQWYLDFAQANNTKMLGKNSFMDAPDLSQWKQSYLDATWDSNVYVTSAQIPSGVSMPMVKVNQNDPTHSYLVGYNDYSVNGRDYWMVPFRFGERPHLVAKSDCEKAAASPPAWSTHPLPNAFSTLGGTKNNQNLGEQALSWVQTNPQKTYPLAIPNGFIKVKLDTNTIDWEPNGFPYFTGSYGFTEDFDENADPFPLACGTLDCQGDVGLEYLAGPTLFTGIFALPPIPPMSSSTFDALYQRVQEMHPGYPKAAFIGKLVACPISIAAEDQEFVIYNSSWDVLNSDVIVSPASAAPPWINGDPDGSSTSTENEDMIMPSFSLTQLFCYGEYDYPAFMQEVTGTRTWTPGTGYGGCLGSLEVHRTTSIQYFGDCACP